MPVPAVTDSADSSPAAAVSGIDLQGSATRSSPTGPTDSGLHQHPPSRLRSCGGCSSATIWPSRAPTHGVIRNAPRPRARTRRTRVGALRAAAAHGPSRPPRSGPPAGPPDPGAGDQGCGGTQGRRAPGAEHGISGGQCVGSRAACCARSRSGGWTTRPPAAT